MRFILLVLAMPALLLAQDTPQATPKETEKPAEDANLALSTALRKLTNQEDLVARVEVEHRKAEDKAGAPGVQGGVMIVQSSSNLAEPFEGRLEAWRAADGTLVMVSEAELPGFALYLGDGRFVKRVTYEDSAPDFDELKAELAPLLDRARVVRKLLDAKLKARKDPLTGALVFRGPVDRGIVKPIRGGAMGRFMRKRALRAEAEVIVSPDGTVKRLAVSVAHSDPLQAMMRKKMRGVRVQFGAGGAPVPVEPEDDDEDEDAHDVETGSTAYRVEFTRAAPSERAKRFKKEIEKLAPAGD